MRLQMLMFVLSIIVLAVVGWGVVAVIARAIYTKTQEKYDDWLG